MKFCTVNLLPKHLIGGKRKIKVPVAMDKGKSEASNAKKTKTKNEQANGAKTLIPFSQN